MKNSEHTYSNFAIHVQLLSFIYIYSKKSPETRSKELLATISPHLITIVKEKAGILMLDKLASQVVKEIMLHALGKASLLFTTIIISQFDASIKIFLT